MGRPSAPVMTSQDCSWPSASMRTICSRTRVADGAHDRREVERVGGRVQDLLSRARGSHARHGTTSIVPNHWKYGRSHGNHTHARRPRLATPPPLSPSLAYALVASVVGLALFASVTPSPLYGTYRELWGFSPLVLTLVYATYAFGVLATLILAGRLSDEVGRRPVLLVALGDADGDERPLHARRLGRLAVRRARAAGARDRASRSALPAPPCSTSTRAATRRPSASRTAS